ncbi:hypothetical protein [Corticibacter populi]|uniref:hypothetical protein n=1 Tax=Corticibacter populi TaxID=1550736 RepID=UPI00102AFC0B|nr:hypothetical protein [Corticibacter populi]
MDIDIFKTSTNIREAGWTASYFAVRDIQRFSDRFMNALCTHDDVNTLNISLDLRPGVPLSRVGASVTAGAHSSGRKPIRPFRHVLFLCATIFQAQRQACQNFASIHQNFMFRLAVMLRGAP